MIAVDAAGRWAQLALGPVATSWLNTIGATVLIIEAVALAFALVAVRLAPAPWETPNGYRG